MSLLSLIKGRRGESGHGFASTAEEVTEGVDLSGKTILITGVNSGLGQESARVLAARGAHIVGAARTLEKATTGCSAIDGESTSVECELSDPASVRACVGTVKQSGRQIDVVLCNAGIMALPELEQKQGLELQFLTNHIGHFILVTGLLDILSDDGRVVMLSSGAHTAAHKEGIQFDNLSGEKDYSGWRAYGQSKLANLLFARELARRFEGSNKTANALHPGVIATNLSRHMSKAVQILFAPVALLGMKSLEQGAATQCYVAAHPDAGRISGAYFADCNVASSSDHGKDMNMAKRLWDVSEEIVAKLN